MRRRTRRSPAAWLLLVALAVSGCSDPSYFPLDARYSWTHRITFAPAVPRSGTPPPFEGTIRNLPPDSFDGLPATIQVATAGGTNSQTILREDSTGVRILALQRPGESEPQRKESLQYILRYPVKAGTQWNDEGEPRFFGESHRVPGLSRIVGFETVTVPAGTYTGAAKVVFHGSDDVELPDGGLREVTIDASGWYAPGVGLVRFEQRDTVTDDPQRSGRFVIELLRFREL